MPGDQSAKCPLTPLISFTFVCFLLRTSLARSSYSEVTVGKQLRSNQTDCPSKKDDDLCPKQLNQVYNKNIGRCQCPSCKPIHLASDIPCLQAKWLGQVCLHSKECSSVQNAACFATILFPVELLSVPTYRQWYVYSQITESEHLNYLLNKVYGQCRCKAGFRTLHETKCVSKGADTLRSCTNGTLCSITNSHCDLNLDRCLCSSGFFFDQKEKSCIEIGHLYGQFCVTSSDCQVADPNLQCVNSSCACAQGHQLGNQTRCIAAPAACQSGQVWNQTLSLCEAESSLLLNSLLVKIVLILLLKLIICNLVRIACYSKRGIARRDSSRMDRRTRFLQSGQSHSLLSLPPYEAIANDHNRFSQVEHLPTYEEALETLRNKNRDYKMVNNKQGSEMA